MNTGLTLRVQSALNLIRRASAAEPISQSDLAGALGCDLREVRRAVEGLRRAGVPVVSSRSRYRGGYWLAGTPGELAAWQATAKRGALAVLSTVARVRQNAEQMALPLEGGMG